MIYTELPKYCKEMTRAELLAFFPEPIDDKPSYTTAFLMRSLIMNELEYCDRSETRTLRGVWYSAIKPTLDKLGLLNEDAMSEDSMRRWDAILSNYVCDLLRKGMLTFADLGIQDISRQKSSPIQMSYGVDGYTYQANVTPYPNILIATEKDTVYSIISKIADLYGCSSISCKGQNSLGAMESIIKGMFSRYRDYPEFDTIYILTMTDYDPAGYYIAEALVKQANDILIAIGREGIRVETHRIGITPDQLSEEDVEQNKYSPKKANIAKWMERTGGINGEEKGLELDAFSSGKIREIFVENLKGFIDVALYKDFVKKSYIRQKAFELMKPRIEPVIDQITEAVIDDVELKEFDIHEIAIDGKSSLYIPDLCEDNMDDEIQSLIDDLL
jgi:hypothetical protein